MNALPPFSRHFAQLVWLLVHRSEDEQQQKDTLRMALAELVDKKMMLSGTDITFAVANAFHDPKSSEMVVWLSELSVRMSAHSVRAIEFEVAATAHDVLGIARALTSSPKPGDGGADFDEKVIALSPRTIAVHIGAGGFVRRGTPAKPQSPVAAPAKTPAMGSPVIGNGTGRAAAPAAMHFSGRLPNADPEPVPEPAPEVAPQPAPAPRPVPAAGITDEMTRIIETELTPGLAKATRLKDLLARLDQVTDSVTATRLIDDVAREAEERAREGLWVDAAEVLHRLHARCDRLREGDLKRAYQFAIRRLEKPALLHGVAQLLPRRREMREMVTALLARSGEAGADALIDLLVGSESTTERHAYRNALVQCAAAIPALVHLLGDGRWYVVRNAVDLLAELAPPDADARIAGMLAHSEPRVRREAASSLAKLGTPRAVLALLQAVQDPAAEVRLQVALGLGTVRNPRAVPWLIEALDKEQDADVQMAMISALGRMPTEDAVARLARAAEPGGMLLRKSTALRLHAVEALAEAGTPSAQAVLRTLVNDRERDVREAVDRHLSGRAVLSADG
jgi:HEAT repeat protein